MKLKNILLISAVVLLSINKLQAQADINNAQAVFIYNFLSHIKWPDAEVGEKYVLGVYGKTKTFDQLKSYTEHRRIGNKTIEVISLSSAEQAKNCNVVFVTNSKRNEIQKINQVTSTSSCLIVSENIEATEYGAVVAFQHKGVKLSYKLDQENAKAQNLIVSTALISMSL